MTAQTDTQGSVTTVYKVSGMSCGHCEGAVSGEISEIAGVGSVQAVASTGEVTVVSGGAPGRRGRARRRGRGGLRARRPGLSHGATSAPPTTAPALPALSTIPQHPQPWPGRARPGCRPQSPAHDQHHHRVQHHGLHHHPGDRPGDHPGRRAGPRRGIGAAHRRDDLRLPCAARVEKKLNRMDGVTATVNYATEKARIFLPGGHRGRRPDRHRRQDRVHRRGAPAPPPEPTGRARGAPGRHRRRPPADRPAPAPRRLRLLAAPVVLLFAMVPALQFDNWQWLSLPLARPVVVWGGLPFHRARLDNVRHGAATRDTLVSLGTLAAFGWSLWALFFRDAGMPGMRHGFDLTVFPHRRGLRDLLLEAAAGDHRLPFSSAAGWRRRAPGRGAPARRAAGADGAGRR
ncbi:cation transporter [Streptomyces thinghirensis]|nr:cation transporter [Streptomyces thinghirensis]